MERRTPFKVEMCNGDKYSDKEAFLSSVKGQHALIILPNTFPIDDQVLDEAGPQCKTIVTVSVGLDHLDLNLLKRRNVTLCHTPGVNYEGTAEYAIALLLITMLKLHVHIREVKENRWGASTPLFRNLGNTLENKVVGIFGLGSVGQGVAKRLRGFNMSEIIYHSRHPKPHFQLARFVTWDELIEQSDVVMITAALTEETKGIFGREVFARMKRNAVIINVARGGLINQDDLINALKMGDIASAGLDVTSPEPLPAGHPLKSLPNVVVTPHKATAQEETKLSMCTLVVDNIVAKINGKSLLPTAVKF